MATDDQAQGDCWRFTYGDGCLWLEWDCEDGVQRTLKLGDIGDVLGRAGAAIAARPDLLGVIGRLYDREINCGLQTIWDVGVRVWIGGELGEQRPSETFAADQVGEIPGWLEREAAKA